MAPPPSTPPPKFIPGSRAPVRRSWINWERLWTKIQVPFIALLISGVIIAGVWMATADRRETRGITILPPVDKLEELRLQSFELEAEFERIRQRQTQLTDQDMLYLSRALEAQEEYVAAKGLLGADNARLLALRRRLHITEAERLRQRSTEAEALAEKINKTDPAGAMQALRLAIESEKTIDQKWVFSGMANPGKIAQLDVRLRRIESEPLWQQGRQQEATAEAQALAGNYAKAAELMQQAINSENEFVIKYRDVRATEFGRVDQLIQKQATWLSTPLFLNAEKMVRTAKDLEQEGRWLQACDTWQKAIDQMDQIIMDYPLSRHADRLIAKDWHARHQAAQLHPQLLEIEKDIKGSETAFAAQKWNQGLEQMRGAQAKMELILTKYPDFFPPTHPYRQRIEFVLQHEAMLRIWAPVINKNILSLGPTFHAKLYRTEVSQALYAAIMGNNPSAQARENFPVDSVSYEEASLFCERLSWILGYAVRLPTLSEYQAACGTWEPKALLGQAWVFENTDGLTVHPVGQAQPNTGGFHDLLGNVEEWTYDTTPEQAWVAGGSVAWSAQKDFPQRKLIKREKSRLLGFRFVVDDVPPDASSVR